MMTTVGICENWEDLRKIRVVGYTLRRGTEVCVYNWDMGPSALFTENIQLMLNSGYVITHIHTEPIKTERKK